MIVFLAAMFIMSLALGGSLKGGIVIFLCWCAAWGLLDRLDLHHGRRS